MSDQNVNKRLHVKLRTIIGVVDIGDSVIPELTREQIVSKVHVRRPKDCKSRFEREFLSLMEQQGMVACTWPDGCQALFSRPPCEVPTRILVSAYKQSRTRLDRLVDRKLVRVRVD